MSIFSALAVDNYIIMLNFITETVNYFGTGQDWSAAVVGTVLESP